MIVQGNSQFYSQVAAAPSNTEASLKGDILSYYANDDEFEELGKRYESLTSYADKAVERFRAFNGVGRHPMALFKLSNEDEAMFRSHSDAWSDIRQSMVWAFLGTEHFEQEE
ncbi:MAG: hypothetical protein Q9205_003145 [Flavoplaca limonia]